MLKIEFKEKDGTFSQIFENWRDFQDYIDHMKKYYKTKVTFIRLMDEW